MLSDKLSEGAAEVEGLEDGIGIARKMEQGYVSECRGGKGETHQVLPNYEKG